MQAHSRWLHAIRKGVITEKKWHKKNMKKYAIVFASTQLRITRLHKYPIDPKAYLGRCGMLTSKASDQPAYTHFLIRAFANNHLNIL